MKKCNGPDMESRKGWFTLFPVALSFSVKFFSPICCVGWSWGNLKNGTMRYRGFQGMKEPILPVSMEEGSWFTERA